MPAKTLMIQGTASSVGKSTLVTALCRILIQDGWKVAPFKAQNMSLNSFVTPDGGEIGRAQAVQAEAAGIAPETNMNPILLKPEAENRSQVVLKGKPLGRLSAMDYYSLQQKLWAAVADSLESLCARFDVVIIEGAGSPAEVNLKDRDLVNMRVAAHCRAPVLLVADIDRGGVFASLIGTLELLDPEERALIKGFVINKFRGDLDLLRPGLRWLEERTRLPIVGVLPYFHDIAIAEEDSLSPERRRALGKKTDYALDIAVIGLPHIANFDDFDPLAREDGVRLRYVEAGDEAGEPDLLIFPGTKSTMADLLWLREQGLERKILALAGRGTPLIGICGGYQMMGRTILDPKRVESEKVRSEGLGLLPVESIFGAEKSTRQVRGEVIAATGLFGKARGQRFSGYEIHMGRTSGRNLRPIFRLDARSGKSCEEVEGCLGAEGYILGTYMHGVFHNDGLRHALLEALAERKGARWPTAKSITPIGDPYDRLAAQVKASLDMNLIRRLAGLRFDA